jgi:glutamate racemase
MVHKLPRARISMLIVSVNSQQHFVMNKLSDLCAVPVVLICPGVHCEVLVGVFQRSAAKKAATPASIGRGCI